MKTFPAFHALEGRKVIVAGGGEAASRKARLAAAAGARIVFAARSFAPTLADEWRGRAELIKGPVRAAAFAGASLAFVAEDGSGEAARIAVLARAAGLPVNVVDRPDLSDFLTPSIIDRGDVVVAISTGGSAPALGRRLRERIEAILPARLSALAAFARAFRSVVSAQIEPAERRRFWDRFFDGPIASRILAGEDVRAREAMIDAVNRPPTEKNVGVVHIVGAGPGDPDLLTLKALRILQSADVIFYDRLVGDAVLALARRDALRIYVGKAKAGPSTSQSEIEQRLVDHARRGKIVVRLKGGDPFIFGRGGEELGAVRAAGVPVFVTPGITAAIGCAAAANMPLTHRDHAQAVTFVTGHAKEDGEPDLDWRALAALGHTLVIYMGVAKADAVAARLIENGRSAATPVAIIERGTTEAQKIMKGRLAELGAIIRDGDVEGPAILVIGEVAALADGAFLENLSTLQRKAA